MKSIALFLIAIILTFQQVNGQNVGDSAPDFTLKNLSNQNFTLSNQQGKVVFIFFMGYACPLCMASSPNVKSQIINNFSGNANFVALLIDTWDGSITQVANFKNSTGISAIYLQKGSSVSKSWSTTYDRLAVVGGDGKILFKGNQAAGSDAGKVMDIIQQALNNLMTPVTDFSAQEKSSLGQNFPNPVLDNTKIEFSITEPANTVLTISDISGKVIATPVNRFFPAGNHTLEISMNDIPGGIYLYKIEAGNFTSVRKMIKR